MKYIYTLCSILFLLSCKDQLPELQKEDAALQENMDSTSMVEDGEIVCAIEQMPEFPGGNEVLQKFLQTHLRYPKINACVNGVVYVSFIIRADGNVTDIHLAKGLHEVYDAEAMRVVALMPRWKPGQQSGKPVDVRYTLPIRFGLSN